MTIKEFAKAQGGNPTLVGGRRAGRATFKRIVDKRDKSKEQPNA